MNHSHPFAIFTASLAVLAVSTMLVADDKVVQDEIKRLKQEQFDVQNRILKKIEQSTWSFNENKNSWNGIDKLQEDVQNCKKQFVTQSQIHDVIKLKIEILAARSTKIENEIAEISKREDSISQTLQKIVDIDQAELSRVKKIYEKGNVGNQELSEIQRKALESTLALHKYRSSLTDEPRRRMQVVRDAIEDADLESKMQEIYVNRAKSEHELAQKAISEVIFSSDRKAKLENEMKDLAEKHDAIVKKLKELEAKP